MLRRRGAENTFNVSGDNLLSRSRGLVVRRAPAPPLTDRKRPGDDAAHANYHVMARPALPQHLYGSEWQGARTVIHCTDDNMGLLRPAALALCLAPGLVPEMPPVSAEGSQVGIKRGSHNDRTAKIAAIPSKPADLKVKLEIHLIIVNRLDNL